jgi:pimeloyl-ACP methyl ester carboxylesterase
VAALYAVAYPERIATLALITGGHRAVGATIDGAALAQIERREQEPWYAQARAALDEWSTIGPAAPAELKAKAARFFYGRWDERVREFDAREPEQVNPEARIKYHEGLQMDVAENVRRLGELAAPVLVYAGGADPGPAPAEAAKIADVFRDARLVLQPSAGHFPWLDDADFFVREVSAFLAQA